MYTFQQGDWLGFKNKMLAQLSKPLPGISAHQEMMPYKRINAQDAKKELNPRLSAVMILLYPQENIPHLMIIERSSGGIHSQQLAFPGGKKEEADENLLATALRETQEEIGVMVEKECILGGLSEVYVPPSNFLISPYLAILDEKPKTVLQVSEVTDLLCLNLFEILGEQNIQRKKILLPVYNKEIEVPYFGIDHRIVWGATALILNEFRWIFAPVCKEIWGLDL